MPMCNVPATYHKIRLTATQCSSVGWCMYWDTLFTVKVMSGRVKVAYWRAPTTVRYKYGFSHGLLHSWDKTFLEVIGERHGLQFPCYCVWGGLTNILFGRGPNHYHSVVLQCPESNECLLNPLWKSDVSNKLCIPEFAQDYSLSQLDHQHNLESRIRSVWLWLWERNSEGS
jgi:hypothetical protein